VLGIWFALNIYIFSHRAYCHLLLSFSKPCPSFIALFLKKPNSYSYFRVHAFTSFVRPSPFSFLPPLLLPQQN
jgi:hypothetical protein